MNQTNTPCDDRLLHSLLQAQEDSEPYLRASRHVDHCARCQLRLEELAAAPAFWSDAGAILASTGHPLAHEDVADVENPCYRSERKRYPTAWTDSMAQQLLSPPSHPEMLGRIGRYEVERLIGWGGMGVVFKAFDTELNRPVAIKVLAPFLAGSGAARKRFAREARAAAAVVHEHVVAIHNVETDGESPFLVMPLVVGESLQQRIDREGPLELCELLRIATQTAAGLAAAHAQGLVHRDVKPSNILLEQGVERTLLTDFGLARASDDASLTHSGYHPGTPQYMSPEQARGESIDARSDLFSLGSVIYAMSTGHPPFRAETTYGILRRITDNEPRSLREVSAAIPTWLEGIVRKLLAKDLSDRFQTAEEVAELLEQCLAHVQQPTAVSLPERCQKLLGHTVEVNESNQRNFSTALRPIQQRWNAISNTWRVGGIVAGVGVLGLVSLLSVQERSLEQLRGEPPDSGAAQFSNASAAISNAVDPAESPALWDQTSHELRHFSDDLTLFEARSQHLWDEMPTVAKE
ncbi:serine/threonine-protein kinase [Aureliella helgolandensis]|uniref:non-specific serine/threonine protein kinase n=1 Tax=Aureliella helgolandensis TaxID=2527968 RepID=A0A518GAY3_9BACT|nr:serine/threonine-protein kinase [Aureliella helgolandensis]QDV25723.1 Serine/threonine-protein kinase PrkC [Aureliella helgolandensis]